MTVYMEQLKNLVELASGKQEARSTFSKNGRTRLLPQEINGKRKKRKKDKRIFGAIPKICPKICPLGVYLRS